MQFVNNLRLYEWSESLYLASMQNNDMQSAMQMAPLAIALA